MATTLRLDLPPCCPLSGNPQAGSYVLITYCPADAALEVASVSRYLRGFVGGRGEVRGMEDMICQIARDCAACIGAEVSVEAHLQIRPYPEPGLIEMVLKAVAAREAPAEM